MNRFRALLDSLTPAQITLVLAVAWGSAIVALILALWLRRRNVRQRLARELRDVMNAPPGAGGWSDTYEAHVSRYRKD